MSPLWFNIIDMHSVFRTETTLLSMGKNNGGGQYPFAQECHASSHSYSEKRRDARLPDKGGLSRRLVFFRTIKPALKTKGVAVAASQNSGG